MRRPIASVSVSGLTVEVLDMLIDKVYREKGLRLSRSHAIRMAVQEYVGVGVGEGEGRGYKVREVDNGERSRVGERRGAPVLSMEVEDGPPSEDLIKRAIMAAFGEDAQIPVRLPTSEELGEIGVITAGVDKEEV